MLKPDRKKTIQLIHIAKAQLGLSDADYRAVLESSAGKSSCSEMSLAELGEGFAAMKRLGFRTRRLAANDGEVGWDASKKQMDYIKGLWERVAYEKTDAALYKFIKRITGAENPRFARRRDLQKVIIALRTMKAAKEKKEK